MKKQILSEQFSRMQKLAGIKPLYEYQVKSYYAWRATDEESRSQRSTLHHPHKGEYVSLTKPTSLKSYEGDDRSYDPEEYSHLGKWPKNAYDFGEGDNGEASARKWVEYMNKKAQDLYAQVEEGGERENDELFKQLYFEQDEEGNIIKYVFSVKTLYHNRTM